MQQLLYSALKNLVELKERKEIIGKDEYYLNEQPIAWEEAKKALRKHENYDSSFNDEDEEC